MKNKSMLTLNQQQHEALQLMEAHVKSISDETNPVSKFFLIKGFAGTGKTTVIAELINKLLKRSKRTHIALVAPTWKAVRVLKRIANANGIHNVDFATIYKILGLRMDYNENGEKVLVEGRDSKFGQYDLIILDEASMVSEKLWNLLLSAVKYRKTKMILMGDPAQLPPIKERISVVFEAIENQYTLTEIMRQSNDNPISNVIAAVRERIYHSDYWLNFESDFNQDKTKGVFVMDKKDWLKALVRSFQSPKFKSDSSYTRAIAWRNVAVNYINDYVRSALYDTKDPYIIGEHLITRDAIYDENGEDIIMTTSTECTIVDVKPIERDGYNVWKLKVMDEEGIRNTILCLDKSSQQNYENYLRYLASNARENAGMGDKKAWEEYWNHRNQFALMNYIYAGTAHTNQGDSITNTFIARQDILANPNPVEKWQAMYVAVSRAKERLFITA